MITVWTGSANTWDCDEMGHMNVRVYVEKAMEGLAVLSHHIDMPHAFRGITPSTLLPVDQHIRFMREVLPGRPLSMTAGILEVGETDAVVFQLLSHGSGAPAAAFRTRIVHAEAVTGRPFSWSARSAEALRSMIVETPADCAPRSIDPDGPIEPYATEAHVITANAPCIGRGAVPQSHCDAHGRMRAEWFMGRISDGVPNLLYDWRRKVADAAGGRRMGAAVLEYRLRYRKWPKAGDLFETYSSLRTAGEKHHSLVHWILDPASGHAWLTSEAVAVTFDLDTRKVIQTPPHLIEELEALAPRGLAI
ncbi:MAG: thioesterase family protein [Pseudomonadota bacterium]